MARRRKQRSRVHSNQRLRSDSFDRQEDFSHPSSIRNLFQTTRGYWELAPSPAPVRTFSVPTWPRPVARPITRSPGRNPRAAAAYPLVSPQNPVAANPRAPIEICVARRIRQEVLHALNQTGKSGQNKPRFTAASFVHCKRKK